MQDIIASYNLTTTLKPKEIEENLSFVAGVRSVAAFQLPGDNKVALEVRFHGQTEKEKVEELVSKISRMFQLFDRKVLEDFTYYGIEGQLSDIPSEVKWTGRDPLDEIVVELDGTLFIRHDYFEHALSFSDIGIRDENTELIFVNALQKWPKQGPAREAIRRLRELYTLLREVRAHARSVGSDHASDEYIDDDPEEIDEPAAEPVTA